MSKLLIEFGDLAEGSPDASSTSKLTISLLRTRIFDVSEDEVPLPPSPGIYLLHPTSGSIQLVASETTLNLPSDMALVVSGRNPILARRDAENSAASRTTFLKVIELNARIGDATPLLEMLELPLMLDSAQSDAANGLFDQLSSGEGSIQLPPVNCDISRHLIAAQLTTLILNADPDRDTLKPSRNPRLEKLKAFLFENMAHPVNNPEMAHHLGMSRTAFCRWAQKTLGCSPARYFRQLRLERSQEWIAQDAGNLDEIASQTGFSHRYHLSREFKKHFGITPAEYRRQTRNIPKAELLVRAAEHDYRHGHIQEALAACEQCLATNSQGPVRDQARYQKGLCLRALGRGAEAITEWSALEVSPLAHRAIVQECRELFHVDNPELALELLKKIFDDANDAQTRDGISLWMDQVLALTEMHRARALRAYLALRKQIFPHDSRSMQIALSVLRSLGENREILIHCQAFTDSCFFALRRTGALEEALAWFGSRIPPDVLVATMSLFGEYEKLLAMQPVLPEYRVTALTRLGRAEEAIQLYPEHAACAYLALGRYEELLDRFPEHDKQDASRTYALVALKRTGEIDKLLDNSSTAWQWFPAQLYLRPEAILESTHPEAPAYRNRAWLLIAMQTLIAGKQKQADDMLAQIEKVSDPDFWWGDHTSYELLVAILIRHRLGDTTAFSEDMLEILANYKEKDKQVLWYDAAYLTGNVSLSAYQRQPRKVFLAERVTFIQAVKQDLDGHTAKAMFAYKQVANTTRYDNDPTLLRQRFAQWRLQGLD